MYLTDTLSRAYLPQTPTPGKSDEEVERIHSVNFLPVSEPQIQETANDPVLQSLKSGNPEISPGGVQNEKKKSKIPKLCQDIGLDELFLEKIL